MFLALIVSVVLNVSLAVYLVRLRRKLADQKAGAREHAIAWRNINDKMTRMEAKLAGRDKLLRSINNQIHKAVGVGSVIISQWSS